MSSKTYTLYKSQIGLSGGRFKSSTPMSAAKKAASKVFKAMDGRGSALKVIHFAIRETTSKSDHKVFKYVAKRIELAKPVVLNIKGKEIVYRYKIDIKADGEAPATSRELRAAAKKTAVKKSTAAKKPCKAGKVRSSTTGRCRKVATKKPCKAGKVRNSTTGRCRKVVAKKATKKATKKPCKKGARRNPVTKRCRKVKGGEDGELGMDNNNDN